MVALRKVWLFVTDTVMVALRKVWLFVTDTMMVALREVWLFVTDTVMVARSQRCMTVCCKHSDGCCQEDMTVCSSVKYLLVPSMRQRHGACQRQWWVFTSCLSYVYEVASIVSTWHPIYLVIMVMQGNHTLSCLSNPFLYAISLVVYMLLRCCLFAGGNPKKQKTQKKLKN